MRKRIAIIFSIFLIGVGLIVIGSMTYLPVMILGFIIAVGSGLALFVYNSFLSL